MSHHDRQHGEIFRVTYLSYSLVLYCEKSMLKDSM